MVSEFQIFDIFKSEKGLKKLMLPLPLGLFEFHEIDEKSRSEQDGLHFNVEIFRKRHGKDVGVCESLTKTTTPFLRHRADHVPVHCLYLEIGFKNFNFHRIGTESSHF